MQGFATCTTRVEVGPHADHLVPGLMRLARLVSHQDSPVEATVAQQHPTMPLASAIGSRATYIMFQRRGLGKARQGKARPVLPRTAIAVLGAPATRRLGPGVDAGQRRSSRSGTVWLACRASAPCWGVAWAWT